LVDLLPPFPSVLIIIIYYPKMLSNYPSLSTVMADVAYASPDLKSFDPPIRGLVFGGEGEDGL